VPGSKKTHLHPSASTPPQSNPSTLNLEPRIAWGSTCGRLPPPGFASKLANPGGERLRNRLARSARPLTGGNACLGFASTLGSRVLALRARKHEKLGVQRLVAPRPPDLRASPQARKLAKLGISRVVATRPPGSLASSQTRAAGGSRKGARSARPITGGLA